MTGNETDLLTKPSYTFDARTTDYENRNPPSLRHPGAPTPLQGTADFPSGVYVLRLINGNDVKTQKIVVE